MVLSYETFSVELDPPLVTATGTMSEREGFVVTFDHRKRRGIGEAMPLAGWTESLTACRDALEQARSIATEKYDFDRPLLRTDSVADEEAWGADERAILPSRNVPAARHGVSLALLTAGATERGQPLYRFLQPEPASNGPVEGIPVNATVSLGGARDDNSVGKGESRGDSDVDSSPASETITRHVRDLIDAGYRTIKLKAGAGPLDADLERIVAIDDTVEAIDDEYIQLRIDANGSWTPDEARQAIRTCRSLPVEYIEQPLPPDSLDQIEALCGNGVDIALDESLLEFDVEALIERRPADVFVLKPMVLGGPDIAARTARRCRAAGIEPVVTTTFDAVIARTAAVHVAATIPNVRACGLATGVRIGDDLAPDPAPVSDGQIAVPQEPGLGVTIEP